MTLGNFFTPICFNCERPSTFLEVNESNDYTCPHCGEYVAQTVEHCWVEGCNAKVVKKPSNLDGIYGYKCDAGHSFRMHPEWGMGGKNDRATWSDIQGSVTKKLYSLENPNGYTITDAMKYFWALT